MILDRYYRDHQPLFKHVLLAEWFLLFAGIFMTSLALPFRYHSAHTLLGSLLFLTLLALFSPIFPDRPGDSLMKRFVCVALDLAFVTGACYFGISAFTIPLYLVVLSKICLLFTGFQRVVLIAACLIAEIVMNALRWHISDALGGAGNMGAVVLAAIIMNVGNVALFLVVSAFMFALISEQKLRAQTEQLSGEVERLATEVERTRIAREMHDTLGHTLTSLKLQLEVARRFSDVDKTKSEDALGTAEQLAARSLTDVRMALRSIRQSDFDFQKAVEDLVKDAESTGRLSVETDMQPAALPRPVAYQLFRVLQECMTNTLKHAGANRVTIRATADGGRMRLVFADDGQGLGQAQVRTDSYGIKGMRERVENLKGTLAIANAEAGGTQITVEVPIEPT